MQNYSKLSTKKIFNSQILSEADHQHAATPNASAPQSNDTNDINDNSKHQTNQNIISSVPIGENESFLLDMVYKCLRGKGVRMINSNYSNSSNINNNRNNESSRIREKENSLENHWSDDEVPTVPVSAVNNPILPSTQRFSSSKCTYMPRAIASNHFNMARGRGTCHVKHSVDGTKKTQQQIFHRIQTQQHNGTFANNMIALRNNGSIMRLNSANLIGCPSLSTITNAINTGTNNLNAVKTTVANVTTTPNVTANNITNVNSAITNTNTNTITNMSTSPNTAAAKMAFKKPVHFVNSIATPTNGPIVLLNPSSATTMSTIGNPRYTIFRRPMNQSIQLIARPTIDPSNSYSVMPVIHRVRSRSNKPIVPKLLETDRLLESLKSIIRPQKINHRDYDTTHKVLSVYHTLVKASNQPNHHLNNTNTNSSSSSKRKSHSSLSNHKINSNHTSSQQMITSLSQKQNGHHANSNGSIITSASNYMSSNNTSNHIDKRTHLRITNDANHK